MRVGLLGRDPGVVSTQLTIPVAVAGVGVHVVPGKVTVAPLSTPEQLTVRAVVPLDGLGLVLHAGAAGGTLSMVLVVGLDVAPVAGLVWVTDTTEPLAGVGLGIHENVPSACTVVIHRVLPDESLTVIV